MPWSEIHLIRFSSEDDSTLGALFDNEKRLLAFTIEDEKREIKLPGETRIPSGRYQLRLRTWGGFHERYSKKFPDIHKGMIEVCRVPGFSDILVHIGNTDADTEGCILLGAKSVENRFRNGCLEYSEQSYLRVYPILSEMIQKGDVYLMIHDDPFNIKV